MHDIEGFTSPAETARPQLVKYRETIVKTPSILKIMGHFSYCEKIFYRFVGSLITKRDSCNSRKMKISGTYLSSTTRNLGVLAAFGLIALSGCTPEGVINKTKYKGEKIVNTCDAFKEEVASLVNANNNSAQLVVAEYDNSEFDYYYLEPGQYEIKDGMLNWRFAGDIEYDKYLVKGVAITAMASYEALDHLKGMENPTSGQVGSLRIDREYYDANKEPVFMYKMKIDGNPDDLNGKQIKISFKVEKYKKGKLKKVFCKTDEVPLGPVAPACCTFQPWDKANPQSVIAMPDVKIDDEKYKYRGFTGTLDLIFPENSVVFDKKVLTSAIQDYIKKYNDAGYKATNINLDGWASLGGIEARNQDLSERRAKAVFEDLSASMADPSIQIAYAGKGEDWERLKLLTKASALSGEEQQAVLSIANGAGSNDEKEAEMRKLAFWTKLVDEVIVNTRHTFVTFKFDYQPDKMYVDYYPSQMPISSELLKVANETMIIGAYKENSGDVKKGLRTLDILIGNNKKANLFAMRSTYHFGNNDFQSAISDIDEAIGLDRNNQQYALAGLAYKTRYAGNYTIEQRLEMMDQYNDYVVRYPDNKSLYANRAVMMDKIGYISGALAEYNDMANDGEPTAASLNNRGVAKLKTMRTTEAEADFRAALDKDSNLAEAYFNLSLIYAYRGLVEKTVAELGKAVARDRTLKDQIWSNPAFAVLKDNPKFDVFR
jgi:outer membrane protein OmpA-like peptidoglycan-associated protein/Flp pilus assembly protein TadD